MVGDLGGEEGAGGGKSREGAGWAKGEVRGGAEHTAAPPMGRNAEQREGERLRWAQECRGMPTGAGVGGRVHGADTCSSEELCDGRRRTSTQERACAIGQTAVGRTAALLDVPCPATGAVSAPPEAVGGADKRAPTDDIPSSSGALRFPQRQTDCAESVSGVSFFLR